MIKLLFNGAFLTTLDVRQVADSRPKREYHASGMSKIYTRPKPTSDFMRMSTKEKA